MKNRTEDGKRENFQKLVTSNNKNERLIPTRTYKKTIVLLRWAHVVTELYNLLKEINLSFYFYSVCTI